MTMQRMFWPICDGCSNAEDSYASHYASDVRESMRRDGWTVGNKLICPACNGKDPGWWKD